MQIVEADFREGQYVSGKLPRDLPDECFFDAPDPDLPVRPQEVQRRSLGALRPGAIGDRAREARAVR